MSRPYQPVAILIDPVEGKARYVPVPTGIAPVHFLGRHLRTKCFKYTTMRAIGLTWCGDTVVTIDPMSYDAAYLIRGRFSLFGFGFDGTGLIVRLTTSGIAGASCRLHDLKH